MKVTDFVDGEYLTHVRSSLSPSTVDGYLKMWAAYGKHFAEVELDLRTCDCQLILRNLCAANPHLNKTTLRHVKNFFSGIWTHALRMGAVDRENPWRSVAIPTAPEARVTHAYAPEEVEAILGALSERPPYDLIVLLAACTGLRKSEIRGLEWRDWDNVTSTLSINRAVWRKHTKTTKSKASKAPVPVVPLLAARLDLYREHCAPVATAPIFQSPEGPPLDLDNAARRLITPALVGSGAVWRGWHAFRRGLATFLHAQDVDDKTIQSILRHENVSITQQSYIKTVPGSVRRAMEAVTFGGVKRAQ